MQPTRLNMYAEMSPTHRPCLKDNSNAEQSDAQEIPEYVHVVKTIKPQHVPELEPGAIAPERKKSGLMPSASASEAAMVNAMLDHPISTRLARMPPQQTRPSSLNISPQKMKQNNQLTTKQQQNHQASVDGTQSKVMRASVDGPQSKVTGTLKRTWSNCTPTSTVSQQQKLDLLTQGVTHSDAKQPKPNMVKPKFDVRYAEHLVHIGNARYVVFGEIDNDAVLRIQECDYKQNHFGTSQTPKMIRFTLQQWIDLTYLVPCVNDAIEEFDELKLHLGRNTYIRVQPQRRRVDIRDFFLPNDTTSLDILPTQFERMLIPTKRGISLTYEEWWKLATSAIPLLRAGSSRLQVDVVDTCMGLHPQQKEWLMCSHCNPNGHSVWS
jgi:hypothetical protein